MYSIIFALFLSVVFFFANKKFWFIFAQEVSLNIATSDSGTGNASSFSETRFAENLFKLEIETEKIEETKLQLTRYAD